MPRRGLILTSALVLAMFSFVDCSDNPPEDFDILIRNGTIVDGTGNPSFQGDVGIVGDTIVEIGDLARSGALKTIDATGLVVSPGFIDVHTHADGELGRRRRCEERRGRGGE